MKHDENFQPVNEADSQFCTHMQIKFLDDSATAAHEDGGGRLRVRSLLREHRSREGEQLVLVTPRDLEMRECEHLFGYADRRLGVAVVSTFRLAADAPERLAARMANVIEHEQGHLDGLRHCRTAGCVMHPASRAEDLDTRGISRCERCQRPRSSWTAYVAALVFCALVFALLQGVAGLVKGTHPNFTYGGGSDKGVVLYRQEAVLSCPNAAQARATAEKLNRLYAQVNPPPIEAVAGAAGAILRAGGVTLASIDRNSTSGREPVAYAQDWAARMTHFMNAKGTDAEGCPDCHIRRKGEVEESARIQQQRRW